MSKSIITLALLCIAPFANAESLTLRDALRLALKNNPEFAANQWEIPVAKARITQAATRPNPELGFAVDDVGDPRKLQASVQISQLFELGGKRRSRIAAANTERTIAQHDTETRQLDLIKQTTLAFIDALSLQQQITFDRETLHLSEQALPVIRERVEAGRASLVEVTRSEIAVANSRMELTRSERDLSIARQKLATLLGCKSPAITLLGDLTTNLPTPARHTVQPTHPELEKADSEIVLRGNRLAEEKAKAVPDLTTYVGPRWVHESKEITLIAGMSFPLPLWSQNKGGIKEAALRIEQAKETRRATALRLEGELSEAHFTLQQAKQELNLLQNTILPGAEKAVAGVDEGYQAGRLTTLDLLEARRTLSNARSSLLRAAASYHKAVAEIEALTACPQIR